MLSKYKEVRRLDLKKSVNKPFENVSCQERTQNFFRKMASKFAIFKRIFLAEFI